MGHCVNPSEEEEFTLAVSRAIDQLRRPADPEVPAMPVTTYDDVGIAAAGHNAFASSSSSDNSSS